MGVEAAEDASLPAEPSVGVLGLIFRLLAPGDGVGSSGFMLDDDVELQPQSTRNCVSFTGMKVPAPVRSPGRQ